MGVGGGGVTRTRPTVQDSDISKALDLIAGISQPGAIKKLQEEREKMRKEADRLLKGQGANKAVKEAEKLKSEAKEALSEAQKRADELLQEATERIKKGWRDLEIEKAEFEDWRDREKRKIQALTKSLDEQRHRLTEEQQKAQALKQKAELDIKEANALKTETERKMKKLMEIVK